MYIYIYVYSIYNIHNHFQWETTNDLFGPWDPPKLNFFWRHFFGWDTIWQTSKKRKTAFFRYKRGGPVAVLFFATVFRSLFYWKNQLSAGGLGPFLKFSSQFLPGFGLRATFGSFAVCLHSKNSVQNGGVARLPTNLSIGKFVVEMMTGWQDEVLGLGNRTNYTPEI